jgi:hypothetical protein
MRIPKWLAVLFFASLALNVGVLAGYFYQTWLWAQQRRHARTYFQGWAPDAERQLNALFEERMENRYRIDSLRMLTRRRLDELSFVENPDSAEVERLLDQTASLERELARVAYRMSRAILELEPPEKRRQTERAYRRLVGLPVESGDSLPPGSPSTPKKGH